MKTKDLSTGRKIKDLHFILLYSFVKKDAREFTSFSAVRTRCYWLILTKKTGNCEKF